MIVIQYIYHTAIQLAMALNGKLVKDTCYSPFQCNDCSKLHYLFYETTNLTALEKKQILLQFKIYTKSLTPEMLWPKH